ncbi:MAG: transmembrane 220 family protein, partial [Bacteroidota bacterium]
LAASGRLFPIATMIMLIVLIVVLLSYIPSIREWFGDGMPSITSSMKAESPYIELVREFFGLLISAAAIAYYVVRGRRIG